MEGYRVWFYIVVSLTLMNSPLLHSNPSLWDWAIDKWNFLVILNSIIWQKSVKMYERLHKKANNQNNNINFLWYEFLTKCDAFHIFFNEVHNYHPSITLLRHMSNFQKHDRPRNYINHIRILAMFELIEFMYAGKWWKILANVFEKYNLPIYILT